MRSPLGRTWQPSLAHADRGGECRAFADEHCGSDLRRRSMRMQKRNPMQRSRRPSLAQADRGGKHRAFAERHEESGCARVSQVWRRRFMKASTERRGGTRGQQPGFGAHGRACSGAGGPRRQAPRVRGEVRGQRPAPAQLAHLNIHPM